MIKEYVIAIKGKKPLDELSYFLGESESKTQIPHPCWSENSFHVERIETTELLFTTIKENARVMTPKNMNSWLKRILEQLPYWTREVEEIRIIQVKHEATNE